MKFVVIILLFNIQMVFAQWKAYEIDTNENAERVFLDIQFVNDSTGYAIGEKFYRGYKTFFYKTSDGGKSWNEEACPVAIVDKIFFIDELNGWAIGYNRNQSKSLVLKTIDGGISWAEYYLDGAVLKDIVFYNNKIGCIVGFQIYYTIDGGKNWSKSSKEFSPLEEYKSLSFIDSTSIVAVGFKKIIRSIDGGVNWFDTSDESNTYKKYTKVVYTEKDYLIVFSEYDGYKISYNKGDSWSSLISYPNGHFRTKDVTFLNSEYGWAVGSNGEFMITNNGGLIWGEYGAISNLEDLNSVSIIDKNNVWVCGAKSALINSIDEGNSWNTLYSPNSKNFNDIEFISPNIGWIVGDNGTVFYTDNFGQDWISQESNSFLDFVDVEPIDSLNCWIIASGRNNTQQSQILYTNNSGDNWEIKFQQDSVRLLALDFYNEKLGATCGAEGAFFLTKDGGESWISFNLPKTEWQTSIQIIDETTIYILAGNGVLKTKDLGKHWDFKEIDGLQYLPWNDMNFNDSNNGVVVGKRDAVAITHDGGNSWEVKTHIAGKEIPLNSLFFVDEEIGWATSEGGIILKTIDGGNSWGTQKAGSGGSLSSCYFIDENNGWLVGAGAIYSTIDGGGVTDVEKTKNKNPNNFHLSQNYPNPFNPTTIIKYTIPNVVVNKNFRSLQNVTLKIYDVLGKEVATLVNKEQSAGSYEVEFNTSASSATANSLSSGVYFYTLRTGSFVETKKMLLLK